MSIPLSMLGDKEIDGAVSSEAASPLVGLNDSLASVSTPSNIERAMPGEGRKKHLGSLIYLFRHRGASWRDLGTFLNILFGSEPWPTETSNPCDRIGPPQQISCRHNNPDQDRRPHVSESDEQNESYQRAFGGSNHYRMPCLAMGSFDKKKNPGIMIASVMSTAKAYLKCIGKGDKKPKNGHEKLPQSDHPEGFLDNGNECICDIQDAEDDSCSLSSTISTISSIGTRDSQDEKRTNTKIRAATLAWLWKFADSPKELKKRCLEMRRLPESIGVLHLCGCGICCVNEHGQKTLGCCERSHLILGDHDLNEKHTSYHQLMALTHPDDYCNLCEIIHRGEGGEGLF